MELELRSVPGLGFERLVSQGISSIVVGGHRAWLTWFIFLAPAECLVINK